MGIFSKAKSSRADDGKKGNAPKLPSLDELHDRIIKAKLNFRQAMVEAESASRKSQAIYAKLWDASPADRAELRKQKAQEDDTVKRKMIQAQSFAKSQATLQDVEIVMQIDQAFAECGLIDAKDEDSMTLEDIQKSLEEAAIVVAKTMEDIERLGLSISLPKAETAPMSDEERELEAMWTQYDRETDPVKKEEIKRRLQEREATPQMAFAVGGE